MSAASNSPPHRGDLEYRLLGFGNAKLLITIAASTVNGVWIDDGILELPGRNLLLE